jgi:hypothetical protein
MLSATGVLLEVDTVVVDPAELWRERKFDDALTRRLCRRPFRG